MSISSWDDALRHYATATHHVDGADTVTESDVAATQRSENNAVAATGAALPSFNDIVNGDGNDTGPHKTESLVVPSSLDEVLGGAGVAQNKGGTPSRSRSKLRTAVTCLVWLLIVSLVCSGLYLIYRAHDEAQVEEELAVPTQTYQDAQVSTEPVEVSETATADDTLTHEWEVVNADSDQGSNTWEVNTEAQRIYTMSVARMAPGSVFIPESGIYMELEASDQFEPSEYGDLQTIHVPTNVHRGVWYSAGAPLTSSDTAVLTGPSTLSFDSFESVMSGTQPSAASPVSSASTVDGEGTTFIASHVAWTKRHRGALYTMATDVKQNELIWVKGFDGSLSTWRVSGMWVAEHQAFPEDYFSPTGPRRLVMTTCGGRVNGYGYYQQNVFLVATPVPLVVNSAQ